jgi:hypothetical protein
MINQGLEFGPFRGEQCFAVEFRGEDLVFSWTCLSTERTFDICRAKNVPAGVAVIALEHFRPP